MFLANFFDDLVKFNKLKMQKKKKKQQQKRKNTNAYNTVSELYNGLLGIYFDKYYELPNAKRKQKESKYDPDKLFLQELNDEDESTASHQYQH